jgi:hypothetical protein
MEHIISKKIKEIDDTLTRCIEDIKMVSSLDKECKMGQVVRDKLSDVTTWLDLLQVPKNKPDDKPDDNSDEIQVPDILVKKELIPSFMLPTFSFLAGTSFTPHIYHEHRSNSTERAMSNEKSQQKLRSESVERTRNRSESVERIRNRSESIERIRNKFENELNRNGRIERTEFRSESVEKIQKK